jgi:hypothetical protein
MVTQCANPECRAQFLYLRAGKLFALRRSGAHSPRVEFFWLCSNCGGSPEPASFLPDGVRLVPLAFDHRDRETEDEVRRISDSSLPFLP